MTNRVVTTRGDRSAYPYIVATGREQWDMLLDLALRDPGYSGVAERVHSHAYFYIWDRPAGIGDNGTPDRWVQVGFYGKFGGLLLIDETTPQGADWAWIAAQTKPIADAPVVYFDQDSRTQFPAQSVMTMEELRNVLLEWFDTGTRPTSAQWLTVNSFRRTLDSDRNLATIKR
jgi:hypothetical protein